MWRISQSKCCIELRYPGEYPTIKWITLNCIGPSAESGMWERGDAAKRSSYLAYLLLKYW